MRKFCYIGSAICEWPIHLGHLVEYIQTDIWVRFQKLSGNEVHYICADDTHGTPIMLKAQDLNISPQELIQKSHQEHLQDFKSFGVDFSYYGSTDDVENKNLVYEIFENLNKKIYSYQRDRTIF